MRLLKMGLGVAGMTATIVMTTLHSSTSVLADAVACDLSQYKAAPGLTAVMEQGALAVTWASQGGSEIRARYAIDAAQPVIRELAVKKPGGQWAVIGQNLTPEYHVL